MPDQPILSDAYSSDPDNQHGAAGSDAVFAQGERWPSLEDQMRDLLAASPPMRSEIMIEVSDRCLVSDDDRLRIGTPIILAASGIVFGTLAIAAGWLSFAGGEKGAVPAVSHEQTITSVQPKEEPTRGDRLESGAVVSSSAAGRAPTSETRAAPPGTSSVTTGRGDGKPSRSPTDSVVSKKAAPPAPARTAAADPKPETAATRTKLVPFPETKPATIEGWTVRSVAGETAVLEGPSGIVRVARGDHIPGVGKVLTIVRWGNRWIVATSGGLISTS